MASIETQNEHTTDEQLAQHSLREQAFNLAGMIIHKAGDVCLTRETWPSPSALVPHTGSPEPEHLVQTNFIRISKTKEVKIRERTVMDGWDYPNYEVVKRLSGGTEKVLATIPDERKGTTIEGHTRGKKGDKQVIKILQKASRKLI